MKVRFWHSDKPRERLLSEAFLEGVKLHGDQTDVRALGEAITIDCDVAVMVGVKSKDLFQAHARAGIQLIYMDKGYARHSRTDAIRGWEYWRVAVNGHHPTGKYRANIPGDRLKEIGWKFKPWRKEGKQIVIAGSSQKYHNFYDLKSPTDWATKLVKQLNDLSPRRQIVYRPKPSWKDAEPIVNTTYSKDNGEGIDEVLKGAHALVTHGSNACFEAMLAGVPSIILGDAVAKPISSTAIEDIEKPRLASDEEREALLRWLAYQQWTMAEMVSGLAWKNIRKQIFD